LVNSGTSATAFRDIMMGGIGGWSTGESHGIDTVYNTASSPTTFSRIESHFDGTSGRFRFRNLFFNSSPRTDILMTIEGNGNVLIGTTTDGGAKLQILSTGIALNMATSNGQMANINSTNANGGYFTWQTSGTTIADIGTAQQIFGAGGNEIFGINGRGARAIAFGTNDTERMRITSGGNVGIGTTSPAEKLHVATSIRIEGSTPAYNLYDSPTSYRGNLQWQTTAGSVGIRLFNMDNSNLMFGTTATERMRITEPGNVLIGTTTDPGDKLRVNGNTFTNTIMTWNPENDNRSGVAWRLGAASIATITPNRRLRVNVGGVEYYIAAVEV
jgi:uncharacterized protein YaiE (UPF0345 family)